MKLYLLSCETIQQQASRILPRLPMPVQFYLSMRRISAGARRTVISRRRMRLAYPLAFLDSLFRTEVPPRLHCPLCFFSARDDALFTPEITQATFARLEAPSKRLVWLPGGGHLSLRLDWLLVRGAHAAQGRSITTRRESWPFAPAGSALERFGGRELSDHNAVWANCLLNKQ